MLGKVWRRSLNRQALIQIRHKKDYSNVCRICLWRIGPVQILAVTFKSTVRYLVYCRMNARDFKLLSVALFDNSWIYRHMKIKKSYFHFIIKNTFYRKWMQDTLRVSYIHFLSKIFFYDKMDLRLFYFYVTI